MTKPQAFLKLIRLDKPIGSLLLLWLTYWALWLAAGGMPPLHLLGIFTLGVFVMRSAGCLFNDWADKEFDGKVRRTAHRPLAAGVLSTREAFIGLLLLLVIALALVWQLNVLTRWLSVMALGLTLLYPFMKRWTYYPQLFLGAAWATAVLMAFSATTGTIPPKAWWLYAAVVFWITAFDTYYALSDWQDDRHIGVHSPPLKWGYRTPQGVLILQCIALGFLVQVGRAFELQWPYWLACSATCIEMMLQYKQVSDACKTRDFQAIAQAGFRAFHRNQWIGIALFLGILLSLAMT